MVHSNGTRRALSGRTLTGAVTAALAAGALAVPMASARPAEPTETYAGQQQLHKSGVPINDSSSLDKRSPDAKDAASLSSLSETEKQVLASRGVGAPTTPASTPQVVSSTSDDFEWGDAAIGAGGAAAAIILASGGAMALTRRRQRPATKAASLTG